MADNPLHLAERLLAEGQKTVGFFHNLEVGRWELQIYTDGGRWTVHEIGAGLAHLSRARVPAVQALGGDARDRVRARRGHRALRWNVDVLRPSGTLILLEADLDTLADRVRAADRPRVNPGASLEEDLTRIWASAAPLYRGAADLVYRTDTGLAIDDSVSALLGRLRERGLVGRPAAGFPGEPEASGDLTA